MDTASLKKDFYCIRHGQTDWNVQRRAMGSVDIPLNPTGEAQVRSVCQEWIVSSIGPLFLSRITTIEGPI